MSAGLGPERAAIVRGVGAVGGADLDAAGVPARAMMSGMRKAPPISISSPRETMASRPSASVLSVSSTAAALLLTTVASSAPVSSREQVAQHRVALAAPAAAEIVLERQRLGASR